MANPLIQYAALVPQRPKCLGCDRPLKPRYVTKTERYRKLLTSQTDPSEGREYDWAFDQDLQLWTKVVWKNRIVSRTWDGTYGDFGEGLFCGTMCGYRYGRAIARQLAARDEQTDHQRKARII
jgi:hypothetical protein